MKIELTAVIMPHNERSRYSLPIFHDPAILLPRVLEDESVRVKQAEEPRDVIDLDEEIEILMVTGLPSEESLDTPPALQPGFDTGLLQQPIHFHDLVKVHPSSPRPASPEMYAS